MKPIKMALPIKSTPKLNVEESEQFLEKMEQNANKRGEFTATPNLSNAEKLIEKYGLNIEKNERRKNGNG